MPTNQYVNNYNFEPEQNLVESLVIEAIQMKGIDLYYLPKTFNSYDYLFGEDPDMAFNDAIAVEMYPAFVEGFGGSGFMVVSDGMEIKDTATFVVSKKRFIEELQAHGIERPTEGDAMYLPLTNSFLSIKFVDDESPFFQHGKQYVWEVKTQLMDFSYEDFDTGDVDIDAINPDYDPETQTDDFGRNDDLSQEGGGLSEFDPDNPFT